MPPISSVNGWGTVLHLNETFAALWEGTDPVECGMRLTGELFRDLPTRRTLRFEAAGSGYFAKIHQGVGWGEIFKNLLQLRWPIVSALTEWRALERLHEKGIATMTVVACGVWGWNPATVRSFIVTEELAEVESLEDLFTAPDRWALPARERIALVARVAEISRSLHDAGVNHRDYYLCHLLLDRRSRSPGAEGPRVFVIDLHRAQLRARTPRRWLVKDVGGLFFSAIGPGLTRRDLYRFMRVYSGKPLRRTLREDARFWRAVYRRGCRMYRANGNALPAWLAHLS